MGVAGNAGGATRWPRTVLLGLTRSPAKRSNWIHPGDAGENPPVLAATGLAVNPSPFRAGGNLVGNQHSPRRVSPMVD
jgi:hypothetical protein